MKLKQLGKNSRGWLLSLGVVLISPIGAFAGNGEGYNGPDLGGISIPISTDRNYTRADVKNAVAKCSVVTARAIYPKLMKRELNLGLIGDLGIDSNPTVRELPFLDRRGTYWTVDARLRLIDSESCVLQMDGNTSFDLDLTSPECQAIPEAARKFGVHAVEDDPKYGGSVVSGSVSISYELVLSDPVYDEYGNIIAQKEVLSSLTFNTFRVSDNNPIFNKSTGIKLPITLNSLEYFECLKTELQGNNE